MVFPAAFLMGERCRCWGRRRSAVAESFGTITARMYAVNTLGAACGAFATAFVLIWLLGIRMTCVDGHGGLCRRRAPGVPLVDEAGVFLTEPADASAADEVKSACGRNPECGSGDGEEPPMPRPLIAGPRFRFRLQSAGAGSGLDTDAGASP